VPDAVLAPWLARWDLLPDGAPVVTPRAHLLPVRRAGTTGMLKVATEPEERLGGTLLSWWDGRGAARVLAAEGDALLLERGGRPLTTLVRAGRDDAATDILCDVIAALHAPRPAPPPDLVPLDTWFRNLWPMAATRGGILAAAAATARDLLATPRDEVPLHGDIHHDNILDFGPRGWLAIDPKRLRGERAFDYANLFCNPDLGNPDLHTAIDPARFAARLEIVTARSGLDRRRLLRWILAWTGLSAAWFLGDGTAPEIDLTVAGFALAELRR
jgi:streptomycin 6-kinase